MAHGRSIDDDDDDDPRKTTASAPPPLPSYLPTCPSPLFFEEFQAVCLTCRRARGSRVIEQRTGVRVREKERMKGIGGRGKETASAVMR